MIFFKTQVHLLLGNLVHSFFAFLNEQFKNPNSNCSELPTQLFKTHKYSGLKSDSYVYYILLVPSI